MGAPTSRLAGRSSGSARGEATWAPRRGSRLFVATLPVVLASPSTCAAQAPDWTRVPLAVDLHPVHSQFWVEWQDAVRDAMAGPNASPLYRETASNLDVYWTLAAVDIDPPWFDPALPEQALDLSVSGATIALDAALKALFSRDPVLDTVQQLVRTSLGAALDLKRSRGGWHSRVTSLPGQARSARARIQDTASPDSAHLDHPPPPEVRFGTGIQLVQSDQGDSTAVTTAGFGLHVDGRRFGFRTFRADATWAPTRRELDWHATARQDLIPAVDLVADAGGTIPRRRPWTFRGGLAWSLPVQGSWELRPQGVRRPLEIGARKHPEWLAQIVLKANLAWYLPAQPGRWPLGQRPGAAGPWLPRIPDHSPPVLAPLVRPPVERALEPDCHDGTYPTGSSRPGLGPFISADPT